MNGGAPIRLSVHGLGKRYCQDGRRAARYALADIAREFVARAPRAELRPSEFLALDGIDLTLRAGEALALIGDNGSGKSTLLKLVCGLIKPSAGRIQRHGSVGAILELGAGLNLALTGRENVILGAALAGHDPKQIAPLLADVIDFAELETAIDAPFQTYSTGMKARLAYALATRLKPDILLVDEALAVGDMHFQRKCVAHMRDYVEGGGALLLVSHSAHQIQAVCDRAILLEHGKVAVAGNAVDTVAAMFSRRFVSMPDAGSGPRPESPVTIKSVQLERPGGGPPRCNEPAHIVVTYSCDEPRDAWWGFSIWTGDLAICITGSHDLTTRRLAGGQAELSCLIPALSLIPGRYRIIASILDPRHSQPYALFGRDDSPTFIDVSGPADRGLNSQIQMGQLTTIAVEWD